MCQTKWPIRKSNTLHNVTEPSTNCELWLTYCLMAIHRFLFTQEFDWSSNQMSNNLYLCRTNALIMHGRESRLPIRVMCMWICWFPSGSVLISHRPVLYNQLFRSQCNLCTCFCMMDSAISIIITEHRICYSPASQFLCFMPWLLVIRTYVNVAQSSHP